MYTLTIFKDLIEKYPNWIDLKNYLESQEGGKLIITPSSSDSNVIIHYNRNTSNMDASNTKWFKSVVWDTLKNIPISVSTPKACNDNLCDWTSINSEYIIEEYLEGVTFSIYMNRTDNTINIASRTKFGATGKYYSNKSFNELILDTLKEKNEEYTLDTFRGLFSAKTEAVSSFATILLQHPEHIVVEHVQKPALYLLQIGHIYDNGTVVINENSKNTFMDSIQCIESRPSEGQTIKEWFEGISKSKSWNWRGIVIKDNDGNRWRIKSDVYHMIRLLRGNTPRDDERFFNLRSQGLVKTYLTYYPEDSNKFWKYEQWIRKATDELYGMYINVNKAKTMSYNDLDSMWKPHITALQVYYYNNLKPENKTIVRDTVIKYMNALPVPRLLFLMNFNNRPTVMTDTANST